MDRSRPEPCRWTASSSPHVRRAPVGQTTEALLYLMPRSLGATCCCSPNVTQCELRAGKY
jgi:hypothetical protein